MINEKDENIISTVINIIKHPKEYEIVPTIEDTTSKTEVLTNKLSEVKQTILAWATLVCAIIAMSAMGPMVKYAWKEHITPFRISSWNSNSMTIFLLPPALIEHFLTEPDKRVKWLHVYSPELSYPLLVHVFISAFSWAVALNAWAISLEYISTVLASICYSVQPLIVSIYFYFIGTYLSKFEIFGVFLSLCGIVISSLDGLNSNILVINTSNIIGCLLSMFGATSDVFYVITRTKQKKYVPLFQYTCVVNILAGLMATIGTIAFEGTHVWGINNTSLFGFLSSNWIKISLLYGFLVGLVCTSGLNYAIQYVNPLVFSSIMLVDPLTTGFISYICGIETLPKLHVWIGGFTVILGVLCVTIGEHYRTSSEQESHLNGSTHDISEIDTSKNERDIEMTR